MTSSIVIAVDGTAASGKGTLAKKLATKFHFAHLDSGKLYRCVALETLDAGGSPANERDALRGLETLVGNAGGLGNPAFLNDKRLLRPDVGSAASKVAAIPAIRAGLLQFQRDFAKKPPAGASGVVIDGRDIGTVIAPDATAKLYVDARPEVRAHRRWLELKSYWMDAPHLPKLPEEATILAELNARDAADKARPVSPLVQARDADLLDTSDLDIDAAFAAALALVSAKVEGALKDRHRG